MQRFNTPIGVQQGSKILFSDFADGGQMWVGEGERETRQQITFAHPYLAVPMVMVGLSMWDMDNRTNLRCDLSAAHITGTGFQIVFRTWGDSRIARVRADWTAMGQIRDDEQWDVE
ncbi:H-type lectin domain-containing protein [Paracoccus sp. IB05]|uniref:H-type lectin domain-containing protein n=1 Tax=Paracoccus sp. IB05 TaxID=2779367 RepID=UPI0018E90996|nr:H-type lectin domain-containing protein [Paracoccus sp. IB05]MBJ2150342.1 H-type lectin domain-containing protein [Paracoccus sp. IB05]